MADSLRGRVSSAMAADGGITRHGALTQDEIAAKLADRPEFADDNRQSIARAVGRVLNTEMVVGSQGRRVRRYLSIRSRT